MVLPLPECYHLNRYDVEVYFVKFTEKHPRTGKSTGQRLETETPVKLNYLTASDQFPVISPGDIIIDAIFGSGLTKAAEGLPGEIINQINLADATSNFN